MMPFPGGIMGTANGIFVLSIAAAFLYLPVLGRPASLRRTAVKAGSIALLAALAFEAGGPLLLVAALALSALGDTALAQEKGPVADEAAPTPGPSPQGGGGFAASPPGAESHGFSDGGEANKFPSPLWGGVRGGGHERFFLAGLAAFFLAHIAYVVLFLRAGAGMAAFTAAPWLAVIGLVVVIFAGGMLTLLWHRAGAGLRLPVAAYTVALLAMVLSALTVPSLPLVIGALLFMGSDALLAWGKFLSTDESRKPAAIAGWVLYYAAQLLITLAVVL